MSQTSCPPREPFAQGITRNSGPTLQWKNDVQCPIQPFNTQKSKSSLTSWRLTPRVILSIMEPSGSRVLQHSVSYKVAQRYIRRQQLDFLI